VKDVTREIHGSNFRAGLDISGFRSTVGNIMKTKLSAVVGCMALMVCLATAASIGSPAISGNKVIDQLVQGNQRYVEAKLMHPNQTAERRNKIAGKQYPVAVIVSCSDSRVPPEIIFDQGLGDLFVIRLAGNIVDDAALGSIEYAVAQLGVRVIVVLGHQKCGAVEAAVGGGKVPGHIRSVVDAIQPAVEKAKGQAGDLLDNAIRDNIAMVVQRLQSSGPILEPLVKEGKLMVVGASYDLSDGKTTFIP
jgi:carbonic anhydrase